MKQKIMTTRYIARLFFYIALPIVTGMSMVSCQKDESAATTDLGEITVHLSTSTRAGENDPLMRNNDDRFSSLATYIFDKDGGFVGLRKEQVPSVDASNNGDNQLVTSFTCLSNAAELFCIANYSAHTGLDEQLQKGMTKSQVKSLVAQTTQLSPTGLLMVGKADIVFEKDITQSETVNVNVQLKRLAARLDVHAFKANDWNADVEIINIEFSGGVTNSTLEYNEGTLSLPDTPAHDEPRSITEDGIAHNKTLPPFNEETEIFWRIDNYRNGSFYTYRTSQSRTSEHAPRINITVRIGESITKTYSAVVANADNNADVTLDAGNVYQVQALLKKNGLLIQTSVAPWDDAPVYDLEFDAPTYTNPLQPLDGSTTPPYPKPTVYYNPDESSDKGTFSVMFHIEGPKEQKWTPTLFGNPEDFEVEVLQGTTVVQPPYVAPGDFQIRVRARNTLGSEPKQTSLAISYTPMWDPTGSSTLMINGSAGRIAWQDSGNDPNYITITQVERN
ncbi:fimbrial protein [Bacteroides thetaiotaomicron]|uniref:fimbrial protein n=1 Tax=Bacteroides thetaiotaomicron TaxID=818 RepID=UPI001F29955D|nr:fimbrial protein [Bacteroides thetaiotaomicron]MCE8952898.1 hypothetical protein [Bacteroides thetaiotaomicron]MCE8970252.1 hypothetical protein [Bacteroides thetaiotaomicron]